MSSQQDATGKVAMLLRERREATGLTQQELRRRAKVSRSRIAAAETGSSLPTIEVCLKLAAKLGIPAGEIVRAHVIDSVRSAMPEAVAGIEAELWGGASHWQTIAEHHGLVIGEGRIECVVAANGDATLVRSYRGCRATRTRTRVVFRDRIVGERPPSFAIKGSPRGLDFTMNVAVEGEWAQHRVEFARPWTADDNPFDFEFATHLPKAFVLDRDAYTERLKREGLPPYSVPRGDCTVHISYAFELVRLGVVFPDSYEPPYGDPTATWGTAPIQDADYTELHPRTCRSMTFTPDGSRATLSLTRPVPGYTFGIHWQPVAWADESEDGRS